jgi:hypothetical protein
MMKRKFFSTIAAVAALFFVTGLLGCSDDDKDPNYGSCTDFQTQGGTCYSTKGTAAIAAEYVCDQSIGEVKGYDSDEYKECMTTAYKEVYQCVADAEMCDGASADDCLGHFKDACPTEWESYKSVFE